MKRILWMVAAAIVLLAVLIWRLVPQSLWYITEADVDAQITIYVRKATFENGNVDADNYTLETQGGEVADLLEGRGYRPDLRNLWPWGVDSVSSYGYDATCTVHLFWENGQKAAMLSFLDPRTGTISTPGRGFQIYHPADRQALDRLIDYVIVHGTCSD